MLAGKLKPNKVPERLWQHMSVDFIMKLPMSKGHDLILVVCNRFLKISHLVATTEQSCLWLITHRQMVRQKGKIRNWSNI